ncbi:hypothetical protein ACFFRR_007254 [Megaselia abdita]
MMLEETIYSDDGKKSMFLSNMDKNVFLNNGEKSIFLNQPVQEDTKKNVFVRKQQKPERNLWREDEILTLLRIFRDNNYVELLSDKATKSENVFRGMEDQMAAYGYSKKNYQQIWTKWKFLKSTYMTSRRANVIPKVITTKTYLSLDNLLSSTFNIHYQQPDAERFYDNGRYDSETSLGSNNNNVSLNNNSLQPVVDMEHPIFGSRLEDDYVKSEPLDIDEFHQQMQEDEEEDNGEETQEEEDAQSDQPHLTIPIPNINNHPPHEDSIQHALGLMPVSKEMFSQPKIMEQLTSAPKTQVPRLKTVPLRKINLKQPHQPIPIAPISSNNPDIPNALPKLLPKPSITPVALSSTPVNHQQKLPKLKLSIKQPINNSRHFEYERKEYQENNHSTPPPAKCPKIRDGTSAGTPLMKPKSMKDLANNMKDMQKDLIADFFKKQQELITEEFEFQRKQDAMLLKSFEDQNRVLLTAAKNLIEQIPSNFYL